MQWYEFEAAKTWAKGSVVLQRAPSREFPDTWIYSLHTVWQGDKCTMYVSDRAQFMLIELRD